MNFRGCHVAIVTPFTAEGSVDEKGLRSNIDYLIANGAAGIVPCGTTGESATLSWEEHLRVVDIALEQAKGRAMVIAGAGSNNTNEAIVAARHAKEAGADAILCITPYYNKPTQEGLFRHFEAITTAVDVPIVVYNVPGRTGVNLLPETLERLCAFPNIVAVKEASGNLLQMSEIHRRCGDRIALLSGDDALTLPALSIGAVGVVSVTGNILPHKMRGIIDAFFAGDLKKALAIHEEILSVNNAMFIETNPTPVKAAMSWMGLAAGGVRLPLWEMIADNKNKLIGVLESSGVTPIAK